MTKPAEPTRHATICGCGRHSIADGADPYEAHRLSLYGRGEAQPSIESAFRGLKADAPRLNVLAADSSGDDVAADAQSTTGGKTLDSIIDECKAAYGPSLLRELYPIYRAMKRAQSR